MITPYCFLSLFLCTTHISSWEINSIQKTKSNQRFVAIKRWFIYIIVNWLNFVRALLRIAICARDNFSIPHFNFELVHAIFDMFNVYIYTLPDSHRFKWPLNWNKFRSFSDQFASKYMGIVINWRKRRWPSCQLSMWFISYLWSQVMELSKYFCSGLKRVKESDGEREGARAKNR